jgi:hypothetical protein
LLVEYLRELEGDRQKTRCMVALVKSWDHLGWVKRLGWELDERVEGMTPVVAE